MALNSLSTTGCVSTLPPAGWEPDPVGAMARAKGREVVVPKVAAEGRAVASAGPVGGQIRMVAVGARPHYLRVEVLSPTDDLLAIATSDTEGFVFWERGAPQCYVGPACAEHVARFLGVQLRPDELVSMLLGSAPRAESLPQVSWDSAAGLERVRWTTGPIRLTALMDAARRVPMVWTKEWAGRRRVEVKWDDWRQVAGEDMPQRMQVRLLEQAAEVEWTWHAIDRDLDVDADAWRFSCPLGAEIVRLPACSTPE